MRVRNIFSQLSDAGGDGNELEPIYDLCQFQQLGGTPTKKVASITFSAGMAVCVWDKLAIVWSVYFHRGAMDFNVKRLAADAGTFLSRAVQVSLPVFFAVIVDNQH